MLGSLPEAREVWAVESLGFYDVGSRVSDASRVWGQGLGFRVKELRAHDLGLGRHATTHECSICIYI